MYHQLRVAAFVCGLALVAGCAGPVSNYVLPAIGAPLDPAETPAAVDLATQTVPDVPGDSTTPGADDAMARQP